MPPVSTLPASPGDKALTQSADSAKPGRGAAREDQTVATPFVEAVREAMETPEENPFALLNLNLTLPHASISESVSSGKPLPATTGPSGRSLPLQFVATASTPSAMPNPSATSEFKADWQREGLMGRVQETPVRAEFARSLEGLFQQSESRSAVEPLSQLSLSSLQALNSVPPGRSGQFLLPVEVPVGQPSWDKAIGERIHWMIGRNIQNAEVKLSPPHLGPLEIRISVQNDQTSVSFLAAQLPTREALEAAIPRLREMLGEANLSLLDVGVGQGGGSGADSNQQSASGAELHANPDLPAPMDRDSRGTHLSHGMSQGILDDYA